MSVPVFNLRNILVVALLTSAVTIVVTPPLARRLAGGEAEAIASRDRDNAVVIPDPHPGPARRLTGALVPVPVPPRPFEVPPNSTITHMSNWDAFEVRVEGRSVAVAGTARIFDNVHRDAYIWSLRIYRMGRERPQDLTLMREKHYVDVPVTLPAGQDQITPEFGETVELDPGRYLIRLSLYGTPATFDWARVRMGEELHMKVMSELSNVARITVTGD
jgi:hypothetical protein